MKENSITIKSTHHSYDVLFLRQLSELIEKLSAFKKAVYVIDQNISILYPELIKAIQHQGNPILTIEATEEEKTWVGVKKILDFFQEHQVNKSSQVIGIGGGITQDLSSFAAHIYYRGISFIYVPTTLLAMSDSCIGSKSSINYEGFKNQLGAFQAPEYVLLYPDFIKTLSFSDIQSGYGEILKLAIIAGEPCSSIRTPLDLEHLNMDHALEDIKKSLLIKKEYIEKDEFDTASRRILNYGHTFGHAIESLSSYKIPHGTAVVKGMDIVNYISFRKGLLTQSAYLDIHRYTDLRFRCECVPSISLDTLIEQIKKDKKILGDKLNLILLVGKGEMKIEPVAINTEFREILSDYFKDNPELYQLKP